MGEGVETDPQEAVKWYKKAAEQGHAISQFCLGSCYFYGKGVSKDAREAAKWLTLAADQGDKEAMQLLKQL